MPDDDRPDDEAEADGGDEAEGWNQNKDAQASGSNGIRIGESDRIFSNIPHSDLPFLPISDKGVHYYDLEHQIPTDRIVGDVVDELWQRMVVLEDFPEGDSPKAWVEEGKPGTIVEIPTLATAVKDGWEHKNIRPHIRDLEQAGAIDRTQQLTDGKYKVLRIDGDVVRYHSEEHYESHDSERLRHVLEYVGSRSKLGEELDLTFDKEVPAREAWLYADLRKYANRVDPTSEPEIRFHFHQFGKPDEEFEYWDEFPFEVLFGGMGDSFDEFVVFIDIEYRNLDIWEPRALEQSFKNTIVGYLGESLFVDEVDGVTSQEALDAAQQAAEEVGEQEYEGDYYGPTLEFDASIDTNQQLIRLVGYLRR